ncbi:MAG: Mrp/NBP35 family ATP-binding protein [Clostridia bacterium]|nr:Mrp/NBP35 family ATP-binding protein [Clostridia bacterium]
MAECNHDCSNCSSKCEEKSLLAELNELSKVKKVIGIVSGKGGVGKSLVTGLLASLVSKTGKKVGVLDADITGPSVPKMFGIKGYAEGCDPGIYPKESMLGTKVISSNLLLENENDPVLWRGPVIAGMVKQFWTDVIWGEVDYMFVDMPPGTGDVPLTVFQSIPLDGIIIVTSPQELVSMIVEKAVKMANMMNIPILGVVENMSYIKCPECGKEMELFGTSKVDEVATDFDLKVLARMPLDPSIAKLVDQGKIEHVNANFMNLAVQTILEL